LRTFFCFAWLRSLSLEFAGRYRYVALGTLQIGSVGPGGEHIQHDCEQTEHRYHRHGEGQSIGVGQRAGEQRAASEPEEIARERKNRDSGCANAWMDDV